METTVHRNGAIRSIAGIKGISSIFLLFYKSIKWPVIRRHYLVVAHSTMLLQDTPRSYNIYVKFVNKALKEYQLLLFKKQINVK